MKVLHTLLWEGHEGKTFGLMTVWHIKDFPAAHYNPLCLPQADQICYAVLCVFSYVAAGSEQKKLEVAQEHAKMAAAYRKQ